MAAAMTAPLTRPRGGDAARLRVIILDDSRAFMRELRHQLAAVLPEVEVTEYDVEQQGPPGAGFDWSLYDVLLLDDDLGPACHGLDWLARARRQARLPPTIVMADAGNEYLAARAIKLGAAEYVNKQDIDGARLADLVRSVVAECRGDATLDMTLREPPVSPHVAVLERLAQRAERGVRSVADDVGYRYVRLIGQGASSRVYLAERTTDATTLVLKIIDLATVVDAQIIERFIREAELVSSIDSPCVVRFYDYGLTQTYGFIAMEFFTRGDLKQRIERGVAVEDALNYLRHIALGLDAIHRRAIVHRDLKPGNIMFRADDSLALADFGISRKLDQTSELTNLGSVLGTPNYLSPEQALGQRVDARADLYSAGVILYEMLAGCKPFRAETAAGLVYQHIHAEIPRLPPSLARFQGLVDGLLAKDPADRIASATDLVARLDAL